MYDECNRLCTHYIISMITDITIIKLYKQL